MQLLQRNLKRLKPVTHQLQLLESLSSPTTSSVSELQLQHLWKVLSASLIALPSQQLIIIIDGVDEITGEKARQTFLKNLLHLHKEVLAGGVVQFKIFLTSRAYDDIQKELKGIPNIERDKERHGKLIKRCS